MSEPFTPPQFTPQNPDFKADVLAVLKGQHFMRHIDFSLDELEAGYAVGHIDLNLSHLQQHGFLHGGVTATVSDLVTGFAAWSLIGKQESVVTADLKISYLHPGKGKTLYARGRVMKTGNLLHFCEAELWIDEGPVIARANAIMCTVQIPIQNG
jgi:uncharacterized protein (TIGR00369 family)